MCPRQMRYRLLEGRLVPILKRGDERDLALAESRARRQRDRGGAPPRSRCYLCVSHRRPGSVSSYGLAHAGRLRTNYRICELRGFCSDLIARVVFEILHLQLLKAGRVSLAMIVVMLHLPLLLSFLDRRFRTLCAAGDFSPGTVCVPKTVDVDCEAQPVGSEISNRRGRERNHNQPND